MIEERLSLKARYVVDLKLFLGFCPFDVGLFGKKLNQLELSLFFFESLLLLSLLELLISHFPEFGELFRFFVFGFTLLLSALNLQSSRSVDSLLHLELAALLFLV